MITYARQIGPVRRLRRICQKIGHIRHAVPVVGTQTPNIPAAFLGVRYCRQYCNPWGNQTICAAEFRARADVQIRKSQRPQQARWGIALDQNE